MSNIVNNASFVRAMAKELCGQVFRHFKGNLYIVEDVALNSETDKMMVVYRALYGDYGLYVRTYENFFEEIPKDKENPTGQIGRFEEYKSND